MIRDIEEIPHQRRVFIYGTGSAGRSLYVWLKKCRPRILVQGFIDSFKQGRCAGKPVYHFDTFRERLQRHADYLILVASGANQAIVKQLDETGITSYDVVSVPSYLMENLLPLPMKERFNRWKINLLSPFFKGPSRTGFTSPAPFLSKKLGPGNPLYTGVFFKFFRRRKGELHLFFGEHGGKFIGNNKYYYLYLREKLEAPVYWVVDEPRVGEELEAQGIEVRRFRLNRFCPMLAGASHFYLDNMTWQRTYPWLRYYPARKIHMSHGVGLKMTEKMLIPEEFMQRLSPAEKKRMDERIFENHLLVSTSEFYARKVSVPAYGTPMERISLCGYPKNDLFYKDIPGEMIFADTQTLDSVDRLKKRGYPVAVYAPTFRDMDSRFRRARVIDYPRLDNFLAQHRMLLVIKGHTSMAGDGAAGEGADYKHILFYDSGRDGYPLLKRADLLITDYSSIYMDFLHARKPVVFFTYDYEEYISLHREIQFDYEEMTPGPKAPNQEELCRWLRHFLVENKDGFEEKRQKILSLAFKHTGGHASERLLKAVSALK